MWVSQRPWLMKIIAITAWCFFLHPQECDLWKYKSQSPVLSAAELLLCACWCNFNSSELYLALTKIPTSQTPPSSAPENELCLPYFCSSPMREYVIPEELGPGTIVANITAEDPDDQGFPSFLLYSITTPNSYFMINQCKSLTLTSFTCTL